MKSLGIDLLNKIKTKGLARDWNFAKPFKIWFRKYTCNQKYFIYICTNFTSTVLILITSSILLQFDWNIHVPQKNRFEFNKLHDLLTNFQYSSINYSKRINDKQFCIKTKFYLEAWYDKSNCFCE